MFQLPSSPIPGTKLAAYVAQQRPAPVDARAEIVEQIERLRSLIGAAMDDTRDLSLAEALEHEWDGRLDSLRATINPFALLRLDATRAERDAAEARSYARSAAA